MNVEILVLTMGSLEIWETGVGEAISIYIYKLKRNVIDMIDHRWGDWISCSSGKIDNTGWVVCAIYALTQYLINLCKKCTRSSHIYATNQYPQFDILSDLCNLGFASR
jgi:hypothetical protein